MSGRLDREGTLGLGGDQQEAFKGLAGAGAGRGRCPQVLSGPVTSQPSDPSWASVSSCVRQTDPQPPETEGHPSARPPPRPSSQEVRLAQPARAGTCRLHHHMFGPERSPSAWLIPLAFPVF